MSKNTIWDFKSLVSTKFGTRSIFEENSVLQNYDRDGDDWWRWQKFGRLKRKAWQERPGCQAQQPETLKELDLNFDDGDGNDDDDGDDDDYDGGCMQPAVDCSRIHKKEDRALAWISTALACKLVALVSKTHFFLASRPFFHGGKGKRACHAY